MSDKLEQAPEGTPVRWQCRYGDGGWVSINRQQYESLIGNWDYELRTINVVQSAEAPRS